MSITGISCSCNSSVLLCCNTPADSLQLYLFQLLISFSALPQRAAAVAEQRAGGKRGSGITGTSAGTAGGTAHCHSHDGTVAPALQEPGNKQPATHMMALWHQLYRNQVVNRQLSPFRVLSKGI